MMAKFKDCRAQEEFISDSNFVFNLILNKVPECERDICMHNVQCLYRKYPYIYDVASNRSTSINKDVTRINNLYERLKASLIIDNSQASINFEIKTHSKDDCIITLKNLDKNYKKNRDIYYKTGLVLSFLKLRCTTKKEFETVIKEQKLAICNSVSYGYKLIKYYKLCETYPKLKYATINVKSIFNNLSDLKKIMDKEMVFWSTE